MYPSLRLPTSIEPLEHRIAPAVVVAAGGLTATYTDVDGDLVTIAVSKGNLNNATFDTNGAQLEGIDLNGHAGFAAANLTITAKPTANGGDGLVNIGAIDATALDLGVVKITGDLGQIDAGNPAAAAVALAGLTVHSLGERGLTTQDAGTASLVSLIDGGIVGALVVQGNIREASLSVVNGGIGSLVVGGDFIGTATNNSGTVFAAKSIGPITVGGSLRGVGTFSAGITATTLGPIKIGGSLIGGDTASAVISAQTFIASVTIGGSMVGNLLGSAAITVFGGSLGPVTVAGGVSGGAGSDSGKIGGNMIASVSIGLDLAGGGGNDSGQIFANAKLGSVKIGGDLAGGGGDHSGSIGTENTGTIGAITILGGMSGGAGVSGASIFGAKATGAIKIARDLEGGSVSNAGEINVQTFASLDLGGSLIGGAGSGSGLVSGSPLGAIIVRGDIAAGTGSSSGLLSLQNPKGPITVFGSMIGGNQAGSGAIQVAGNASAITVWGDVNGGGGGDSGQIFVNGNLGSVKVAGNLEGGAGTGSGSIFANGAIGSLWIGGSVSGSSGDKSGYIHSSGLLAKATILGDLTAPSAGIGDTISYAGTVDSFRIGSITIGGSVRGNVALAGGALIQSGAILSEHDIASVLIKGHLEGNGGSARISALGALIPTATTDLAIGSINVLGRVDHAQILAGYFHDGNAANEDAQIGTVTANEWVASSVAAGIAATDGNFGDVNDAKIGGGTAGIVSKIASIVIKSLAIGTSSAAENFGFTAQHIGSVKIGATTLALTAGAGNDTNLANPKLRVGIFPNLFVHELM